MKNKGLVITLIILLLLIVIALIIFLVSCLNGGINFKNGIINFNSKQGSIVLDKTFAIEDITNIEVRQDMGNIRFEESQDEEIRVIAYGEEGNNPEVNLYDNKLTIDYKNKQRFILFGFGGISNDVIIRIPSSYSNEIKIKNDYGNCEMIDLKSATVNIDSDAGNVEIGKIKNATIKCDYGNIEVKEILNKCDIKADCGNIEIEKISIQEDSSIKSDLGNISIGETNDIYIDAKVDLGKLRINKSNRNSNITLKIECDMGDVSVDSK